MSHAGAQGLRAYVASFVENTLGLPSGELDRDGLPEGLVGLVSSAVRGSPGSASETPLLESELQKFSDDLSRLALEGRGHVVRKARWPGAAPFAACITHDVDNITRPVGHLISRRKRFSSSDIALALLGLRSLYDNISLTAETERARGVRSSFFVLTSNYDLRPKAAQLSALRRDGWDIGLHGDFGTHVSSESMKADVERFSRSLGFRPEGVREHFLKFDFDNTWQILDTEGFAYDSSVGNRERLGFRVGLCSPFVPPGPDWRPLKVLELPLVLMDTTLWGYLKLDEDLASEKIKEMLTMVAQAGGLFTILWHQEAMRMKGGRLFAWILDELVARKCFIAPGSEVTAWWNSRSVPLVREGDSYRIANQPPPGLCLELEFREGLNPVVEGGVLKRVGGKLVAEALSSGFSLVFR